MSATEIDPGQGVAVFALPIPASAMAMITDCVERVYGTTLFYRQSLFMYST